jgi:CRP-like cAMP-binding protein
MLLVVEGHVAFAQYAPDGRVSYLGVYGSGTFVGLATVDGEEQPLELEALGPVVMLGWPAELVRTIAQGDPGFLIDLVDHLAYRVRLGLLLLQRQTFAPARARLASFLLRNESLVSAPTSRLLRRHMAALAGVSREMVGRILRRWEREGIVERVDGGLVLVDRDRLEEEAAAADDLAPEPRLTVPPAA